MVSFLKVRLHKDRYDYSRDGRHMSLRELLKVRTLVVALAAVLALHAYGQYPGQVAKDKKDKPELRAIAVLEWTGDAQNPKASRLVPVAVLDGGQLQDGSIYLARPEPMAVAPEVEYELQLDGKPVGLFDVHNAGQQLGSWVGFGAWKPLAKPKPKQDFAKLKLDDDVPSDEPVLHRKHHADDPQSSGKTSGSDSQAPPADPDRPTLHKKTTDSTGDASTSTPAPDDPDRPTLHKKTDSDASAAPDDPDRPVLKKKTEAKAAPASDDEFSPTDPNRPRLRRGKSSGDNISVLPSLEGLPLEMNQQVAVSDSQSRPVHVWSYSWSNPEDEPKMKLAMEEIARTALGIKPPAPAPRPKPKTAATAAAAHKPTKPAALPPPAPLMDEQFRVFELAYGSGATLVLTAHTDGPAKDQKYVTLIGQPDLYGNVLVLLKNVTDGSHLDEKPRMKLIDAVDAMADNRGELLFELRGATQRQFALYRVMRGTAEQLLVSGGADFADSGGN
jgi:hypothetical protein